MSSLDLRMTSLGALHLSNLSPLSTIANCLGSFLCPTGSTLADAQEAHAILPTVSLAMLFAALQPPTAATITIGELIQAMLLTSEYPWEQLSLQGLQDVPGIDTLQHVHYHLKFSLDCSVARSYSAHVKLPAGFFVKAGSSQVLNDGPPAQPVADPTGNPRNPTWSSPPDPCGVEDDNTHAIELVFESYAGLTLGTQTSDADVTAAGTSHVTDQAPVLVTQRREPDDSPATAPAIGAGTLAVGHIATSNDQDFYRLPLDGLAPGTKVTAYLKVPSDADLDLVVNKPSPPGVQSSGAAGSIGTAGSIPIEDTGPGVDNSTGALQPDAQSDVTVASIGAAGSIGSAGSIGTAGSISANRGSVNEVTQIVTHGETGAAVIGVGGYNGAFSSKNYVLRVKVTPPPIPLPCDQVNGLSTATPGTLPSVTSLPASTKALFLVNRQRMVGLYGATKTDALLNGGVSSPLSQVASMAGASVLQVDGNAAVRTAYSTWDANPCNLENANAVVRSINDLVATYRSRLPNLKYIVLLGTDQLEPSWRQPDLTESAPEVDEANDLAFTTQGLSKGNSIYATAAQNAILTDGAYGHFTPTNWLGHDIPLPQISVSRMVETPDDITAQLSQFLSVNGVLNPHTALTTGDSFFNDGAAAADAALTSQFPGLSHTFLNPITPTWNHADVLSNFFNKSPVPDIGAVWAHYSQWLAQPAGLPATFTVDDFATTADVKPATRPVNGRLLFTVGCHSGLNVPDTLPAYAGGDSDVQRRFKDWAQAYGAGAA